MRAKQYTTEERRSIVAAMQADANRRGAEPDFRALASQLGPTRPTLTTWWRAAVAAGEASVPTEDTNGTATAEERERAAWLLHHTDDGEVIDAMVATTLALIREARARDSWTAVARMDSEVRALVLERRAGKPSKQTGPIDYTAPPAEIVAALVPCPELVLEAFLASPELWGDPRLLDALGRAS